MTPTEAQELHLVHQSPELEAAADKEAEQIKAALTGN